MTSHFQISATVSDNTIEILSDIFLELGAEAITMTDATDEPLFQLSPDDAPLWKNTTLHALFNSTDSADQIVQSIKNNYVQFHALNFYIEKIESKNWVEETQKYFHAQQFNHLWICPRWEKNEWLKKNKSKKNPVVFIEPGLAFGTGTHPTTQLCLIWLATHPLKNKAVIDYGCGSGILALAACSLNAKTVWATDHDDQALLSTENNAKYNHFKNALFIVNTDKIKSAHADIIVANILANPLIALTETFKNLLLPKGKLILSGILASDANRVAAAYENYFTRVDTQQKDEWVLMEFEKTRY